MTKLNNVIEKALNNSYMEVFLERAITEDGLKVTWDDLKQVIKDYGLEDNPSPNCFDLERIKDECIFDNPPFRIVLDVSQHAKMSTLK